ncbi:MAG TPA: PAS domain-containing protein [Acetobacteraceae bacterium]|nr:PAS domain-containing protein [Acetobacteraceae bacterium]
MAVAVWAIALLLASLLATGFCIVLWNRRLQREAEAARRTVEAREAEILRGQEAERRAAEAVAASERRYRALTEAGAIAAWRATPEGRLIEVPGWEALTGQPEARLLVRPDGWLDSVHPEDRAGADAAWRAALREGNSYDREYRRRSCW